MNTTQDGATCATCDYRSFANLCLPRALRKQMPPTPDWATRETSLPSDPKLLPNDPADLIFSG